MSKSDELREKMDQLVGTSRSAGCFSGGDDAGQDWSGYDIYEWFPDERQMVHRVDVEIFGGRNEALELFARVRVRRRSPTRRPSTPTARSSPGRQFR
ncbi:MULTISPECIES: hypothetical protein [Microbacterium]|uniref:hypothetical protein n=1 Tax=Microbacterium TaxID=33882 RepID=UPI000F8ED403|nr:MULTISPECIES: hypothetical protein [Microbacterium]